MRFLLPSPLLVKFVGGKTDSGRSF